MTNTAGGVPGKKQKPKVATVATVATVAAKNVLVTCIIVNSVCLIVVSCLAASFKNDGDWSAWGSWGDCSTTCNWGLRSRNRTCTNPVPSLFGKYCRGSPEELDICYSFACPNGGMADWKIWSDCSVTCGEGIRTRQWHGELYDSERCQKPTCDGSSISFSAYGLAGSAYDANAVRFPFVTENQGGAYQSDTGIFKCVTPGLYRFKVVLSAKRSILQNIFSCNTYLNNTNIMVLDKYSSSAPHTSERLVYLAKNDVVYVSDCFSHISYIRANRSTVFTGKLVFPDM